MELSIKNFAKIKEADITIDGITVIAGENNTGKSTVGKILFSLFNALSNIEDKIVDERLNEIQTMCRSVLLNHIYDYGGSRIMAERTTINLGRKIRTSIKRYLEEKDVFLEKEIWTIVEREVIAWQGSTHPVIYDGEAVDEISQNIVEILEIPEEDIVEEVISTYFNNVFSGQINTLSRRTDGQAVLELKIKRRNTRLFFEKNECKAFNKEVNITHQAIYIDNPFIVDELTGFYNLNPMENLLVKLLTNDSKEDLMDGIIGTMRTREKLNDIFKALQNVVDGEIIFQKESNEFYLKNNELAEPVSIHNLSTGMKSFVILKMLLEKGALNEKDVVILDEPEIHLHPQWQIAYAELIVLLQKQFDLSVVVTTHSPYFVDAINLFSCKYETDSRVNYYLSSSDGNTVKMENVTNSIDLIYKKMASPIQMLDNLRYELNND